MTIPHRTPREWRATNVTTINDLRQRLPQQLVLPDDPDWDAARAAWNLAVDQQPAAVAVPASTAEVVQVVDAARAAGLHIAAQATGHAAGALALRENTILLKTSRLNQVHIDTEARSARVGAGAVWLDVTAPASASGLAPLAGSSPNVGIAGYTLGGGLSWLSRRYGLAANSTTALEVVTADARARRIDAAHDPDLFWALRGGGGTFAVVTALELRLYPVPQLYAGWLVWAAEQAGTVLRAWLAWTATVPDEVSSTARLLQVPSAPHIPEPLRGRNLVVIDAAMLCDEDTGNDLLRELRRLRPELDTFTTAEPVHLSRLHMDPEDPIPVRLDHALLDHLDGGAIDALVSTVGPGTDSPLVVVELRHLGGALARPTLDAGALSTLEASFALHTGGVAAGPEAAAVVDTRSALLIKRLRAWDTGRRFLNFAETHPLDARSCYPAAAHQRLTEIKSHVDPNGLFLANPSIAASGPGSEGH
jgi:FAD/FMN-containing dehydrogenase